MNFVNNVDKHENIMRVKLKICKIRTNVRMSTKKYVFDANTRENTWLFALLHSKIIFVTFTSSLKKLFSAYHDKSVIFQDENTTWIKRDTGSSLSWKMINLRQYLSLLKNLYIFYWLILKNSAKLNSIFFFSFLYTIF